jgi:osmotically-inducible protein OsmY
MSLLTDEIERKLAEAADLSVLVEEDGGRLVLTGLIASEVERSTALDLVAEVAGALDVDDNLEVSVGIPQQTELGSLNAGGMGMFPDADSDLEEESEAIEPGDFTEQPIQQYGDFAAGPSSAFEDDEAEDGATVFVPPTDPVGTDREVIGGLATTSLDDISVEPSSDGRLGDEAIAEAIVRELREDAATTALSIEVEVIEGAVTLRGTVMTIEDAESVEEVAARVPGVVEVDEQLEVEHL